MISQPMVCSAQTVHVPCVKISIISKWNKLRFHLSLVTWCTIRCFQNDFLSYGMFGIDRAPIWHQDCQYLKMKWNKILHDTCHLVVPSCASKMIFVPIVRSVQTVILHQNEIPHDPRYLGVSSAECKRISEPMVCSVQTVHLSCVKISTISKQTETSFRLSLVTWEYHRVPLKRILSLWYVRRKPCTYLASRLALSPKGAKRVSTSASSSRSTNGCIQNDFWADGILAQTMHLSCTDTNIVSKRTEMRFHKT
jgi:hypothetical protein